MQEFERSDAGPVGLDGPQVRCTVHVPTRRVLVNGRETRLGGRAFDLLLVLVRHHGQVVPKQALHDAVWPGLAVTPNNLDVQVWALRRCLGAGAIHTVARRGYALTTAVQVALTGAPGSGDAPAPHMAPEPDPALRAAKLLLPRLASAGRLTLVGGDALARARLCDALCGLHIRRAQGPVWRLQGANAAHAMAQAHGLRRLAQVGGLLVLVEGDAAQRARFHAWAHGWQVSGRLLLLATAAQADAGVDAEVHRVEVPLSGSAAIPSTGPRQPLRWQTRAPTGAG